MTAKTARANARPMPASDHHPDAELLALISDHEAAQRRADLAGKTLEEAESKRESVPVPCEVYKTERDRELGLFIGPCGGAYHKEEIDALRALRRRIDRWDISKVLGKEAGKAYERARVILSAWRNWRDAEEAADARAGYTEALRADDAAMDVLNPLTDRLVAMPAKTLNGVLAKARALREHLGDDEGMAKKIMADREEIASVDDLLVALSLARDVLALAGKEAANV